MEHATQVALTRRVLDFVDRNTTELAEAVYLNPTATYTCPNQAERERDLLFRGHPLFFGLSCELGKPGDWRADDLSGFEKILLPVVTRNSIAGAGGQFRTLVHAYSPRPCRVLGAYFNGYISYPADEPPYAVLWGLVNGWDAFTPAYGTVVQVKT